MPFTRDAFLDVFAAYNLAVWPAALGLWLLTAAVFVAFVARVRMWQPFSLTVLAVQWLWSGLIYHFTFFTRINPAAWAFATLFVLQGIILFVAARSGSRVFQPPSAWRLSFSSALIIYALAYPAIVWVDGFAYPRMPTFGVPCPTVILTIGLLLASSTSSLLVASIPIVWALIGGSAAWLFGVHADLVLPASAVVLAIDLARQKSHVTRKFSLAVVLAFLICVPVFVPPSTAFAAEYFLPAAHPDNRHSDESTAKLVGRRFGREAVQVDRSARLFVSAAGFRGVCIADCVGDDDRWPSI